MELHTKPTVLLNAHGFYDHLLHLFERLYGERFARPSHRRLLHVAEDAGDAWGSRLQIRTLVQLAAEPGRRIDTSGYDTCIQ